MRVAIAKDVITQVKAKQYIATQGTYLSAEPLPNGQMYRYDVPVTKENVDAIEHCKVCAIGSAVLSGIRLFNEIKFGVRTTECPDATYSVYKAVDTWFERTQAVMMEDAFEDGDFGFNKYETAEDRLIAIFQNIIDHEGTFVPETSRYPVNP